MLTRKNTINLRSLPMIFAVLVTVLWCGANTITTNAQTPPRRVPMDFTGDGRSDWATITNRVVGAPLRWKVTGNPAPAGPNQAFQRAFDYGIAGNFTDPPNSFRDFIYPDDYTGDRKTDVVVWRPGTPAIFYVAEFPIGTGGITLNRAVRWGQAGDNISPNNPPFNPIGDYDGDGKADYTAVRASSSGDLTWYIMSSATGAQRAVPFGTLAGFPEGGVYVFPGADFNNDGKDELVLVTTIVEFGPLTYFIGDSTTGAGVMTRQFGVFETDYSVAPADYTGDGRADFVVARQNAAGTPATWYINNSATNVTTAANFGISNPSFIGNQDLPVRGDYDGDGRFDIAVYRQSNQTFYYLRSSTNNTIVDGQKHGDPGDEPLASYVIGYIY